MGDPREIYNDDDGDGIEFAGKPLAADPAAWAEVGAVLWGVDFRGVSTRLAVVRRVDGGGYLCRDDHGSVVEWPLSRLFVKRPTNAHKVAAGLVQVKGGAEPATAGGSHGKS